MNFEKTSAIAEIVSSIAILITLVYLAIQTNQNTGAINSASHQQLLNSDLELLREMRDAPDISQTMRSSDPSLEERRRLSSYLTSFLRVREYAYFQYRDGRMDEDTWNSYALVVKSLSRSDIAREIFENSLSGDSYSADFVEAMRGYIHEND